MHAYKVEWYYKVHLRLHIVPSPGRYKCAHMANPRGTLCALETRYAWNNLNSVCGAVPSGGGMGPVRGGVGTSVGDISHSICQTRYLPSSSCFAGLAVATRCLLPFYQRANRLAKPGHLCSGPLAPGQSRLSRLRRRPKA